MSDNKNNKTNENKESNKGIKKSYGEAVERPVVKPPRLNTGKPKDK